MTLPHVKYYKGRLYNNPLFLKHYGGKLIEGNEEVIWNLMEDDMDRLDNFFDLYDTEEEFLTMYHVKGSWSSFLYSRNMFKRGFHHKLFSLSLKRSFNPFVIAIMWPSVAYIVKRFFILEAKLFLHNGSYLHLLKILTGNNIFWISMKQQTFKKIFKVVEK